MLHTTRAVAAQAQRQGVSSTTGARAFSTGWHQLGDFATTDENNASFRAARAADAQVQDTVNAQADKRAAAPAKINWADWKSRVQHKDLVDTLQAFVDGQGAKLDAALSGGQAAHAAAVAKNAAQAPSGSAVFQEAVNSCAESVKASERTVANGAKALWVSQNNPNPTEVSTSEWLDVDQYWAAFVEKHHTYHNHLRSIDEDPESKEYAAKIEADVLGNQRRFDDLSDTPVQNKMLNQRPSYEYYSVFKGPLVEHMVYYLAKTGGDARFFPELIPHAW